MILLITLTNFTLAFIISFCLAAGFFIGCIWMASETKPRVYEGDSKLIDLDEYETFEIPKQSWRGKKETVNN